MAPRLQLHERLKEALGSDQVYFQPPPSVKMEYPAIVYKRFNIRIEHADNEPYWSLKRYQVTVIDRDPDSDIPDKIKALPMCSYDRFFTADELNHDIFNLFF